MNRTGGGGGGEGGWVSQHIGMALSGGGHRATMWSLGTLLYLVDSGKHRDVAAISSSPGGLSPTALLPRRWTCPRPIP